MGEQVIRDTPTGAPPLTVSCAGPVDVGEIQTVVDAVRRAVARRDADLDRIEVRIEHASNPAHTRPVEIAVELVGPGPDLIASADGATAADAGALVHDRLRRLLRQD